MKLFRIFGLSVKNAFKSVFRNMSLSLASISCITITLIVVTLSLLASFNVNNFTNLIKKDVTVVVFINKDASSEEEEELKRKIIAIDNVDSNSLVYKSKEETKNEMTSSYSELANILNNMSEEDNPLKNSITLKVNDVEHINETAETIKAMDKVSSVNYGEGTVEKLVSTFKVVEKGSVLIVIALILVTVFLINNTIKLTIDNRKEEINIMRVVGASNFTIRNPFVIEGMLLGLVGSIVPIIITTYGYMAFYNHFNGYLFSPLIRLIKPEPFIYQVSLAIIVIGILVGMVGSFRAVRRYLKI